MVGGICLCLLISSADLLEQTFLLGSVVSVWCSGRAESLMEAFENLGLCCTFGRAVGKQNVGKVSSDKSGTHSLSGSVKCMNFEYGISPLLASQTPYRAQ